MGKEILTFGNIEIEKINFTACPSMGCRYWKSISI